MLISLINSVFDVVCICHQLFSIYRNVFVLMTRSQTDLCGRFFFQKMQPNRFEIFQTSIESESENKSTIVIVAERLSSIVRNSMSVKLKRTIAIIVVVIVSMVIENHRCFEWHLFSDDLDIIRNTVR